MVILSRSFRPNFLPYKLIIISDYKHNQFTQTRLYSWKKDPRFVTGFLEADGHLILFISYTSPNKLQDGLVIVIYFNCAIPIRANIINPKIHTIVVLTNANWCSAPQLQNSISASRNYSTLATQKCSEENFKLNPWWLSGFVDGEGCFSVLIRKNKKLKEGWQVQPCFQIGLHVKDKDILRKIQITLGVGKLYQQGPSAIQLKVENIRKLERVINHFNKFKLITKKEQDFKLFILVTEIMKRKEHLTKEGLLKIVAIKTAMNLGFSEKLKKAFPGVVPVSIPQVKNPKIQDPYWLAGFTSGEGSFIINITASQTNSIRLKVQLVFQLAQHSKDKALLIIILEYLGCGTIYKHSGNAVVLRVFKFDDIVNKIIPFFQKYPIVGVKGLDFADWCEVAEMMKDKKHLTAEGLDKIKKIKAGMNTGRK